jgi:histidine triad (HIT) family protein
VVPKRHIPDIVALGADAAASAALLRGIRAVAEEMGLGDFRTVFNTGAGAGQSVFHVHAHVLAGRPMSWPPG